MVDTMVADFFSKFLNTPIYEGVEITLSSAQRARAHGWLTKNSINFDETVLNKKFKLDQLLLGSSRLIQGAGQKCAVGFSPNLIQFDARILVGIDIQSVSELFPKGLPYDPKNNSELNNIFTLRELSYAQSKEKPEATLAGIFCAKEAIQKIPGSNLELNQLEVLPDENGRPTCKGFSLSIAHSGDFAIAIALYDGQVFEGVSLKKELAAINIASTPEKSEFIFRKLDLLFLIIIMILAFCIWLK